MPIIRTNVTNTANLIKQTVTIEGFLKKHVLPKVPDRQISLSKLDPYAVQVSILCPFHSETVPSFRLHRKGNDNSFTDWYCYGSCRAGGSVIELYKHMMLTFYGKQLSYVQALEGICDLYNIVHEPFYFEEDISATKIRSTGISQQDIENILMSDFDNLKVEPIESHEKYLNLIENHLRTIKKYNFDTYVKQALELDYLMSLGLTNDELHTELKTLYIQFNKLN